MKKLLFILCLSCTFFGCSSSEKSEEKRILRLAMQEDPITLDPRKGGDVLSSHVQLMLFEGLVRLNADSSVSPGQCSSFTLSPDGKTYTFHLGKTKWSNGDPVTAHDFSVPWKQILSPNFPAPNAHLFYAIKNAEAVKLGKLPLEDVGIYAKDDNTLVVELEKPVPYFLPLITFCSFAPIPTKVAESDPNWALAHGEDFVSNGPFLLKNWSYQKELKLKKNPNYNSISNLDEMHILIIRSEETAFALYAKGELDLIGDPFSVVPKDSLPFIPEEELLFCPVASTTFVTFNTGSFPFSNKQIRKAFGLSIHRGEITSSVLEFGEKPALSAVCPNLKGGRNIAFYPDFAEEEAKTFLKLGLLELGISKEELESSLVYLYPPHMRTIAQVLQQQWLSNLGVHVKLQCVDPKTLLSSLSSKQYTFANAVCRAQYLDPISVLERFLHKSALKNYPAWENTKYKSLVQKAGEQKGIHRLRVLEEAEHLLLDEMVVAPIFHSSLCFAKKSHVKGIELSPTGGIFFERLQITP